MIRLLYRLVRNLLALALLPLIWPARLAARPRQAWVRLDLRPRLIEIAVPRPFIASFLPRFGPPRSTSLMGTHELIRRLANDKRVKGLVVTVPPLRAGWSRIQTLREQLSTLRATGKAVVIYLKAGGGNRELWLATVGTRVLMAPQGTLGPLGLVSEATYIRPLLDKVGLRIEVEARREFKTAAERAVLHGMSEAQREQTLALMQRIDAALREGLEARGVDVDALLEAALVNGRDAVEAKVVDALVYDDALALEVTGKPDPGKLRDAGSWLAWHTGRIFTPFTRPKYVAVVPIHGAITMQAPRRPDRRPSADCESLTRAIRAASRDRRAVGVVLHVDSPGGLGVGVRSGASGGDRLPS